jgi:hypothetical protein
MSQPVMYEKALAALRSALDEMEARGDVMESVAARDEVFDHFQPIFALEHLPELDQDEFHSFLLFKNNRHWSSLHRHSPQMCADMPRLREALAVLLDDTQPIGERVDYAVTRVHGMGKAVATAILLIVFPEKYGVWNGTSERGLRELKLWPAIEAGLSLGERYAQINETLRQLAADLQIDLWTLDVSWWGLPGMSAKGHSGQ